LIGLSFFSLILSFKQGSFLTNTYAFCFGLMVSRQAAVTRRAFEREQAQQRYRWWNDYYRRLRYGYGQVSPQT
jgi:hypothetical protein